MERHTRRNAMRLLLGLAGAGTIYGAGYYSGTQRPSGGTPSADARPPLTTPGRPAAGVSESSPTCTTVRNGEGILSAASRTSGKGPLESVSVTGPNGKPQSFTIDELQSSNIVVHPGDTVCIDNRPSAPSVAVRTPERRGERLTKSPTVFNQREFREGNFICGPATLASIFTTYGIPGMTPDAVREELRKKGLYSPEDGTIFRNSSRPNDVVRWLQREKNFSVRPIIDIQGKGGGAPVLDTDDLKLLQKLCEDDYALITSGILELEELGNADHILWINEVRPETGQVKVIDPWMGKYEWRPPKSTFKPLLYIYAAKPR